MRDHAQRRPPLPVRLTPAERDFHVELRRLVDAAGLSFRALEESTSAARSDSGESSFYSKSQWGRWLNGQSHPPRKAVRKLAAKLGEEDIDAGRLVDLWDRAFVAVRYPQEPAARYRARSPADPGRLTAARVPRAGPGCVGRGGGPPGHRGCVRPGILSGRSGRRTTGRQPRGPSGRRRAARDAFPA